MKTIKTKYTQSKKLFFWSTEKKSNKERRKIVSFIIISLILLQLLMFQSNLIKAADAASTTELYSANSSILLDINYTVTYESKYFDPTFFEIWIARLNNWSNTQTSDLVEIIWPDISYNYSYDPFDIYNNSYDYFYAKSGGFGKNEEFKVVFHYQINLTSRKWEIPTNITLNSYDKNSDLYQFYTSAQPYCESNDSLIISKAQELTANKSTIVDKAYAIYHFVISSMTYKLGTVAVGAKKALETLSGDCSEYSSLMVALLRASGIPARKALGLGIVSGDITQAQPKFNIYTDESWNYSISGNNSLPGHAWVQYYVPDYGWVSADPTWGGAIYQESPDLSSEYFNKIDYLHLITTIGDWYGEGIEPPLDFLGNDENGINEFPYLYPIGNSPYYDFDMILEFRVLKTNIIPLKAASVPSNIWLIILTSGSFLMVMFLGLAIVSKKRSIKRNRYNKKYSRLR